LIFDEFDRDSGSDQDWYQYGWYLSNWSYLQYTISKRFLKLC